MRLDLVIPAHNEEARIDATLRAYRSVASSFELRFTVALDSCSDATGAVVSAHAAQDPRVRCLEFPKLGKGGVIREALRHCDGELVGFVDADGATPPRELLRLAEVALHADGAIASRRHPAAVTPSPRALGRRLSSAAFAALTRGLFRLPFSDTQCGAKVLRGDVMHRLLPLLVARDFLFDVDLLVTADRLGCHIVEVPSIWINQQGSKVRNGRDASRMALGSLVLWLHHRTDGAAPRRGAGVGRRPPETGAPTARPAAAEGTEMSHAGS
ncbi:MAG: glycosyltransferase [Acidimicrobiia bacterium]